MAKILVVDDRYFVRIKFRNLLEQHHHEVIEAEHGLQALEIHESQNPELIFCDVIMPHMDGIMVLKKIRETDSDVPIIMVTSLGEQTILMEAIDNGAQDVIIKPFSEEKVVEILGKYLK